MSAGLAHEIASLTGEHVVLVAIALFSASLIGIPAGVFLTRSPSWRGAVLGFTNVVQTIPSLALFGFLIPLPFIGGIGKRTATTTSRARPHCDGARE